MNTLYSMAWHYIGGGDSVWIGDKDDPDTIKEEKDKDTAIETEVETETEYDVENEVDKENESDKEEK